MKKLIIIGIGVALLTGSGCNDPEIVTQSFEIIAGEDLDQSRLTLLTDTVQIMDQNASNGKKGKEDISLVIKSRLDPPMVDGEKLMATSVSEISGGFVASYNYRGAPYRGSLDYVNSNLKLRSQVIFNEMDVHALHVSEAVNRQVYLAGASEIAQGASMGTISLSGNDFFVEDFEEVSLGSYAATSVYESEDLIFVTTGDDENDGGGLYLLDLNSNQLAFEPIHDARWVTVKGEDVFVLQGTPGMIHRYTLDASNQTLQFQASIAVSGADIPESKSTLWIQDSWMFVAGGTAGVHLINLETSEVINTLTFEADDAIVNAVAANDEFVFVSCGEAGVYIASYDETGAMETLGFLDLALTTSVNHIYIKSGKLYVAAGLEGLLYMQIK